MRQRNAKSNKADLRGKSKKESSLLGVHFQTATNTTKETFYRIQSLSFPSCGCLSFFDALAVARTQRLVHGDDVKRVALRDKTAGLLAGQGRCDLHLQLGDKKKGKGGDSSR